MKVSELIEKLKELPTDADVCFEGTYCGERCDISSIDIEQDDPDDYASGWIVMLNTTA